MQPLRSICSVEHDRRPGLPDRNICDGGKVPSRRYNAITLPPSSTTEMTPPEHGSAGIRFGGSGDFLCPFERQNFAFSHLSACRFSDDKGESKKA